MKNRSINLFDNIGYINYIYSIHSRQGENMTGTIKRPRYFLDIDPEVRKRVKALAALKGETMKDWLTEAIIAKLEDEIDATEGLASLANSEGSMSLEAYLQSKKDKGNSSNKSPKGRVPRACTWVNVVIAR